MIRVMYVSNAAGGSWKYVSVPAGTSLSRFLRGQGIDTSQEGYTVSVNRTTEGNMVQPDYILQDGDRVTVSPNKFAAA